MGFSKFGPLAAGEAGGDCCGSLEARLEALEADMESSGVGIGTRDTVSLEISGHLHRSLLFWDDARRRGVYVTDPTNWGTYVEFSGEAEIEEGFEAGFVMSLESPVGESASLSQDLAQTSFQAIVGRAAMYLSSNRLGKLSWGRETEAHDHITEMDLSGTGLFTGPGIADWNGGFSAPLRARDLRDEVTWGDLTQSSIGDGENAAAVRYETPGESGPKLALSWGAGRVGAAALTWSSEGGTVEIEAGVALSYYGEALRSPCLDEATRGDCLVAGGSVSALHVASGLGISLAAGGILDDPRPGNRQRDAWLYGKAFEKLSLTRLGETVLYAEHFRGWHAGGLPGPGGSAGSGTLAFDTAAEMTGAGVMQSIEAAEVEAYIGWRRTTADTRLSHGAGAAAEPRFEAWMAGMRVSF